MSVSLRIMWELDKENKTKMKEDKMSNTLDIRSIDLKSHSAKIIGNLGENSVALYVSPGGLSFFEFPEAGNPVYTTVYPILYNKLQSEKAFLRLIAIISKHTSLQPFIDMPMPSQYYGYCDIVE